MVKNDIPITISYTFPQPLRIGIVGHSFAVGDRIPLYIWKRMWHDVEHDECARGHVFDIGRTRVVTSTPTQIGPKFREAVIRDIMRAG